MVMIYFCFRAASLGGSVSTVVSTQQQQQQLIPFDKLDPSEIKDLLICFLFIVKNLSEGEAGFLGPRLHHVSQGSFTLSEGEGETNSFSLIFVTAQYKHKIGFSMNSSGSAVTLAFVFPTI